MEPIFPTLNGAEEFSFSQDRQSSNSLFKATATKTHHSDFKRVIPIKVMPNDEKETQSQRQALSLPPDLRALHPSWPVSAARVSYFATLLHESHILAVQINASALPRREDGEKMQQLLKVVTNSILDLFPAIFALTSV